jgi:Spy/CpxP family protein refolding chaperone
MKSRALVLPLVVSLWTWLAVAQDRPPQPPPAENREPPPGAYEDCKGKKAGDLVQHTTPEGRVAATCVNSPQGLAARPSQPSGAAPEIRPPRSRDSQRPQSGDSAKHYSTEQAVSDNAQLHTIAFNGLAFLTGDFGSDTFLPPGKVSDYFGFQYMRDIDAREGGHNTSFLTRIAHNMLFVLNAVQKAQLRALAEEQEKDIRVFAEKRLPLIKAFRQNLQGDIPAGSKGLAKNAVMRYSAELYALDGQLAYQRAKVMGSILRGLNGRQKAALAKLKFGDSGTWPDMPEQLDKRGMSHEVNVAVMTYASEMFSWYAGSIEADTYFCPERHGMYFGGFGMKTAPAMGKPDYSISTSLTGDSGEAFLSALTETQRRHITELIELQRHDLNEIISIRRRISTELRRFINGESADREKVMSLSRRYGELDGEMSYFYATAFARVGQTLTAQQKQRLSRMRVSDPNAPAGPFLYSTPINTPNIENTGLLFGVQP